MQLRLLDKEILGRLMHAYNIILQLKSSSIGNKAIEEVDEETYLQPIKCVHQNHNVYANF